MNKAIQEKQERAIKALDAYDSDIFYHSSVCAEDSFKDGYVQGATEQDPITRAQTIEEVCQWLEKNAWKYDYGNGYRDNVMIDDLRKKFKQ